MQITFGNIQTINGRNVVSGSSSGIDIKKRIEAETVTEKLRIKSKNVEVEGINNKLQAYSQFRDILNEVKASMYQFTNPTPNNPSNNVFEYKTVSISSNTNGSELQNTIAVAIEPGTQNAEYKLQIKQLATSTKYITPASVTIDNISTGINDSDFTINIKNADNITTSSIKIAKDSSVQDIVNAVNTSQSNITANVINIAKNDYKIIFKANNTGIENDFTVNFSDASITTKLGLDASSKEQAKNAVISLDGINNISRSSNEISDLIAGTRIVLSKVTAPGENITIKISDNISLINKATGNFVDKYNKLMEFIARQNERKANSSYYESAVLGASNNFQVFIKKFMDDINTPLSDSKGNLSSLFTIGFKSNAKSITINNNNTTRSLLIRNNLLFDATSFNKLFRKNSLKVRNVFEDKVHSSNPLVKLLSKGKTPIGNIGLNVDYKQVGNISEIYFKDVAGSYQSKTRINAEELSKGMSNGDIFSVVIKNSNGSTSNIQLRYSTADMGSNYFKDMESLLSALNNTGKLTAGFTDGRLNIKGNNGEMLNFSDSNSQLLSNLQLSSDKIKVLKTEYRPFSQSSKSVDVLTSNIFGVSDINQVFTDNVSDGDQLKFNVIMPDGTSKQLAFNFNTTIANDRDFNSIITLRDAINKAPFLSAKITKGRLEVDTYNKSNIIQLENSRLQNIFKFNNTQITGGILDLSQYVNRKSITSNDISDGILGANNTTDIFSMLTDNNSLKITVTDSKGAKMEHDLIFKSSPVTSNEFNNLASLKDIIKGKEGLDAYIKDNRLFIIPLDYKSGVTVSSNDNIDTSLGLTSITASNVIQNKGFAGYKAQYTGSESSSVADLSLSQGIITNLYKTIDSLISDTDHRVKQLNDDKTKLQTNITTLQYDLSALTNNIIKKYSALESIIASANNTLNYLDKLLKTQLATNT